MPQLIESIDKIARVKNRDVLFVAFHPSKGCDGSDDDIECFDPFYCADELPIRTEIIKWMDNEKIKWCPCNYIASDLFFTSYRGHIYIDVVFSADDPDYQKVIGFLENPDGTMRYPDATLYCLTLKDALRNAHHDLPGHWDSMFDFED